MSIYAYILFMLAWWQVFLQPHHVEGWTLFGSMVFWPYSVMWWVARLAERL